MIIGVTHINENPNHELVKLFDPTVLFQTVPLLNDVSPLDNVLEVLSSTCDKVVCYGRIYRESTDKVEFLDPLIVGSRNSPSIFQTAMDHPNDMILYIPSHIICSDYPALIADINQAIHLASTLNQFVLLTTERWSGPDHNVGWCSSGHYIAPLPGLERSRFLLEHAQNRAHDLHDLRYRAATGICVFPSSQIFDMIKLTMPTYYDWIMEGEWAGVCDLSFEQAVLENVLTFQTLHSTPITLPGNHFYQIYLYLNKLHGKNFTSKAWTTCTSTDQYEISIRLIEPGQVVDLMPGVYFKHGIIDIETLDDVVFRVRSKSQKQFDEKIQLMWIRSV